MSTDKKNHQGIKAPDQAQIQRQTARRPGGFGMGPGPGGPGMAPGEKAKDFKGTIKTLWRYLRPYRGRLIISSLATVFSVAF